MLLRRESNTAQCSKPREHEHCSHTNQDGETMLGGAKSAPLQHGSPMPRLQHASSLRMHSAHLRTCACVLYALVVVVNSWLAMYGAWGGTVVRAPTTSSAEQGSDFSAGLEDAHCILVITTVAATTN